MTSSPFDHRPDPDLGRDLRDALTAPDPDAFARRVEAAALPLWGHAPIPTWWDELSLWARPGLLAAAAVALFAVLAARDRPGSAEVEPDTPVALLATGTVPEVGQMLVTVWNDR